MWNIYLHFDVKAICFYKPSELLQVCISIKYRDHEKITILRSLAHRFFNCTTTKVVTDLYDIELEKRQCKTF